MTKPPSCHDFLMSVFGDSDPHFIKPSLVQVGDYRISVNTTRPPLEAPERTHIFYIFYKKNDDLKLKTCGYFDIRAESSKVGLKRIFERVISEANDGK